VRKLIAAASALFVLTLVLVLKLSAQPAVGPLAGQEIFRYDTFGDEQLWTDVLKMHEAVAAVDPATALAVGLKVDVEALPAPVIDALRAGQVDLKDPKVTVDPGPGRPAAGRAGPSAPPPAG
jgi:hypothetical protein